MTESTVEMGWRHVHEGEARIRRHLHLMDDLVCRGHRDVWRQAYKFLIELEAFQHTAEAHWEEAIVREQASRRAGSRLDPGDNRARRTASAVTDHFNEPLLNISVGLGAAMCRSLAKETIMADQKHTGNPGNFAEDREKASRAGHTGGQHSSGNFGNDKERAAEAGKKGGQASSGGTHEQHVKAGQQSHKNS